MKRVRSGVERRRGRGLKARDPGRRETVAKVLKDRRSPRGRGRMGTSVIRERAFRKLLNVGDMFSGHFSGSRTIFCISEYMLFV